MILIVKIIRGLLAAQGMRRWLLVGGSTLIAIIVGVAAVVAWPEGPPVDSPDAGAARRAIGNLAAPVAVETEAAPAPAPAADPAAANSGEPAGAGPGMSISCPAYGEGTGDGTKRCTVRSRGGFSGTVQFSCSNLPANLVCNFLTAVVDLPAGGSASVRLEIMPGNLKPGTYRFSAVASIGGVSAGTALSWKTADPGGGKGSYTFKCPVATVVAGGQTQLNCEIASWHGFGNPVTLNCLPYGGLTCRVNQNPTIPVPYGTTTVGITIDAALEAHAGIRHLNVEHQGNSISEQPVPFSFQVNVVKPVLNLSCSPGEVTIPQGSSGRVVCRLDSPNAVSGTMPIAVLEGGENAAFDFESGQNTVSVGGQFTLRIAPHPNIVGHYTYVVIAGNPGEHFPFKGGFTAVPAPAVP
jgi:hypothetical protein